MERISAADLELTKTIKSIYIVKSKRLGSFRDREGHFMTLLLGDNTGEVQAILWEGAEEKYPLLAQGDLVLVSGRVREYAGTLQINLDHISVYEDKDFDPADFLPVSPYNREEMLQALKQILAGIKNPSLRELLDRFFLDNAWLQAFAMAPAAKKNHQAYLGGLMEHTLKVTEAANKMADVYPQVDKDLLIAGAVLHDIGKIEEYQFQKSIDFTDQGRLLGHIVIGVQKIEEKLQELKGFPDNLRLKLLHIITSHHGNYEWQSPKRPKFLEAAIIHHLDNMDATVDMFSTAAGESYDTKSDWTGWIRGLERFVYKG